MQSARRTQSDETRANLHDAHQRIMSVATLQQQLAASRMGEVDLRSYFTDLYRSIGASMIRDHDKISLDVSSDESQRTADVSISLGLMVTELVINAPKYAYPGRRIGQITVGDSSDGPDWRLSVAGDGVVIAAGENAPAAGLGTNNILALANSFDAKVATTDAKPGVSVSIVHHDS